MNVYDKAYELKRALMESSEVKDYKEAWDRIKIIPSNRKMLDDFKKKQIEIQAMQFSGQEPDKDKLEQVEKLYSIISMNSDVNNFLQCEYKFSVLINDIGKIISDAIDLDFGPESSESK